MINRQMLAHAIRFLSVDAVERAKSGHPGMPLGMADVATVLWTTFLKHNPLNPNWFNRDRFVLSNGHGSMLLYALLHLTGYALSIDDLKHYRQLHSKTPGHPECTHTPGVETTTGPLGQGLANAVGMAIAEKTLAVAFNDEQTALVDHHTYCFVGDGCLMEGISHEVCSLAGTLGLGKLIVFYDDNGISIDGPVDGWFTDDSVARFSAYNWQVIGPIDGHDPFVIEDAIRNARAEINKPSLIICKTIIGYGSAQAGTEAVHGSVLGGADIQSMRERLHWPYADFEIPSDLYAAWSHVESGAQAEQAWLTEAHAYQKRRTMDYHAFLRRINGDLPDAWSTDSQDFMEACLHQQQAIPTRKASQLCLDYYAARLPELLGGSADLTGSNNTDWSGSRVISRSDFSGNYLHYGVREFGMSAIMNGLALHGGFIPYGGTFLVFSDYARNAVRLSAMMHQRVIFVYTHDSIGLGGDGPTHQPIEQLAVLRMTPCLHVWRPADLVESAVAWQQAIEHHHGPSCLVLSRQALPALSHTTDHLSLIKRGGYIIHDCQKSPDAIIISTGSEVHLAIESALEAHLQYGLNVRVVSMPCVERFLVQSDAYQERVLPKEIRKRVVLEASASAYWYRFAGLDGAVIGIDQFGLSAPPECIYSALGITVARTVAALHALCNAQ